MTQHSAAYGQRPPHRASEEGRGRRVFSQVVFAMIACCALLTFGAGLLGSQYVDLEDLKRHTKVDSVLAKTLDGLSAYSFDSLAEMDGHSILENPHAGDSDYRVDLAVTPASNGLLKIRAILLDNRTSREVTRVVTWRGRG